MPFTRPSRCDIQTLDSPVFDEAQRVYRISLIAAYAQVPTSQLHAYLHQNKCYFLRQQDSPERSHL